jgi:hypothetical protein
MEPVETPTERELLEYFAKMAKALEAAGCLKGCVPIGAENMRLLNEIVKEHRL